MAYILKNTKQAQYVTNLKDLNLNKSTTLYFLSFFYLIILLRALYLISSFPFTLAILFKHYIAFSVLFSYKNLGDS